MPSLKFVDTQNVAIGGRADNYWKTQKKFSDVFAKLRKPSKVLPKELSNGKITDQQILLQYFELVGFEYGNWLNNNERFNFLLGSVIALLDISDITGIKKLGFRKVSLAFGARGKSSAAAHFEPGTFAINLTKEYGVNALAHEYGHALDFFFGTYIDQDRSNRSLSGGMTAASVTAKANLARKGSLRYLMIDLLHTIVYTKNGELSPYYRRLKRESMGAYYIASTEIFARTFEQYVQYTLKQKGVVNRYLAKSKYDLWMYLTPAEFKSVIPKMKVLIKAMALKAK